MNVFISYSRVDGVFAEMLRDALVARGHTVRLDKQDIVPGEDWRKRLHHEFNATAETTNLPERPDYEKANAFLIEARRSALSENLP